MTSLRQGDIITVSKEEYTILRSKVTEQKSDNDKLNKQLKEYEEELKLSRLIIEKERSRSAQLASEREDEKTLLNAIQRVKSTGIVDSESETESEKEPIDQILFIVVKQNTELKQLRSKLQKQVHNIELLVDMVIKLKKIDHEMYQSGDKAIAEPVKHFTEKLSYPVQCSDMSEPADMLLNKNQVINHKDIENRNQTDYWDVKSSDAVSAQSMSSTSSSAPRTLRTESERSGSLMARFSHQLVTNVQNITEPKSPLDFRSQDTASLTRSYSDNKPSRPTYGAETMFSLSSSVRTSSDASRRMQDSSINNRECPLCYRMFSVATPAEMKQFQQHVDHHLDDDDYKK